MSKTQNLINLCEQIIVSGEKNGHFETFISTDRVFKRKTLSPSDIATSALILDTAFDGRNELTDRVANYLLSHANQDLTFHFFENKSLLPADKDTTSSVLNPLLKFGYVSLEDTKPVLNRILQDKDGFEIYFNPEDYGKKNREDLIASCNIGIFLAKHDALDEFSGELEKIKKNFKSGKSLKGQRYWFSPFSAVYFATKLNEEVKSDELNNILINSASNLPKSDYFLDVVKKYTSFEILGLEADKEQLINHLEKGIKTDAIYKRGSRDEYFGSEALSAAFASEALRR